MRLATGDHCRDYHGRTGVVTHTIATGCIVVWENGRSGFVAATRVRPADCRDVSRDVVLTTRSA